MGNNFSEYDVDKNIFRNNDTNESMIIKTALSIFTNTIDKNYTLYFLFISITLLFINILLLPRYIYLHSATSFGGLTPFSREFRLKMEWENREMYIQRKTIKIIINKNYTEKSHVKSLIFHWSVVISYQVSRRHQISQREYKRF